MANYLCKKFFPTT